MQECTKFQKELEKQKADKKAKGFQDLLKNSKENYHKGIYRMIKEKPHPPIQAIQETVCLQGTPVRNFFKRKSLFVVEKHPRWDQFAELTTGGHK